MIVEFLSPWTLAGLAACSVVATLLAQWIVAGFRRPAMPGRQALRARSLLTVVATLIWMALLFVAGVLAARYIERIALPLIGYLAFGLIAFLLSLVQAHLWQRIPEGQGAGLSRGLGYNLSYLLPALLVYVVLSLLRGKPVQPLLLIPLGVGALLPDLDSRTSFLGRLLPFFSHPLEARLGHLQAWHTPAINLLLAAASALLIPLIGVRAWALLSLGFFIHLLVDLFRPEGILLLWPLSWRRHHLLGSLAPGSKAERWLVVLVTVLLLPLLFVVDWGPPPPPPVAAPSYEQTVSRYYSLRGRALVFAHVRGSWQATGRPMSGNFEILNATGPSFIMLDRYDGKLFSAGRRSTDNLYLDNIALSTGSPVRVKPVEVRLENEPLANALPAVYSMQREPGLQHIYVCGDVVLQMPLEGVSSTLKVDYAQAHLQKIQAEEPGHYTLHYLTAAELIGLSDVQVETADLVIVATYATPAEGPTVTPLPPPLATGEAGR